MPLYEHIFLGRQDITAQQFEALIETYQAIIKDNGGSIEKMENWGPKVLTYKIKKNRKAYFALLNIDAPHEAVAEMERQMGISTEVIRFLTLRVEEHETGPSAMMKRGDRDDRRGGRFGRDGARRDRNDTRRPRDDHKTTTAKPPADTNGKSSAPAAASKAETPAETNTSDDSSAAAKDSAGKTEE
ncbi:MAG: 30S ribosomal protein S6 [Proteobacteria bacterium]|nr:30S ribosomal protein S6 [Pseudomonadota bacterium]